MGPPTKKSLDNAKREAISKQLKDAYRYVLNEPLPKSFDDLLRQLDDETSDNGST